MLVEEIRAEHGLDHYFASAPKPNDPSGQGVPLHHLRWLFRATPLRWLHGWRSFLAADLFDRAVAPRLTASRIFVGFAGSARHSFRRVRQLGFQQLVLESPTSHVGHVQRQHRLAAEAYPIEESWLNPALVRKTLGEYAEADVIRVTSDYALRSFLDAGVPSHKVQRWMLSSAPRFAPPPYGRHNRGFHVVYVGRLQVTKGVPVLLEAFTRLSDANAALTLVGGFATSAMERYTQRMVATDRRIRISPGDPLPHLHRADVLVHPSFEDGLGLAPLEALATGVPVIVTADTGMKELISEGQNGFIVPTGDVGALLDGLQRMRARPLKGTFDPLSQQTSARLGAPAGRWAR